MTAPISDRTLCRIIERDLKHAGYVAYVADDGVYVASNDYEHQALTETICVSRRVRSPLYQVSGDNPWNGPPVWRSHRAAPSQRWGWHTITELQRGKEHQRLSQDVARRQQRQNVLNVASDLMDSLRIYRGDKSTHAFNGDYQ